MALSLTIAVGSAMLLLNLLIFAFIFVYLRREKKAAHKHRTENGGGKQSECHCHHVHQDTNHQLATTAVTTVTSAGNNGGHGGGNVGVGSGGGVPAAAHTFWTFTPDTDLQTMSEGYQCVLTTAKNNGQVGDDPLSQNYFHCHCDLPPPPPSGTNGPLGPPPAHCMITALSADDNGVGGVKVGVDRNSHLTFANLNDEHL